MERVRLPILSAFMEHGNGNVAWSELGIHRVAFPSRRQSRALPGRAIGRGWSLLGALGGHARVVPRRGAAVVVHEEGPAGLRVDLDLPAGGRGSRSPLPDATCIMGEWVTALMLGRGLPAGARVWGAGSGRRVSGRPPPWAPLRRRRVREAGAGHLYELKAGVTWPERGGSVWK